MNSFDCKIWMRVKLLIQLKDPLFEWFKRNFMKFDVFMLIDRLLDKSVI